ncbi:MAG: hypothetical protein LIP09_12105 [Bacteroidales bacterium]|nr:hypothetical protein [Bacteroidales bacterium]
MRKIIIFSLGLLLANWTNATEQNANFGRRVVTPKPQELFFKIAPAELDTENLELLVSEDFSKMTAGTEDEPDGTDMGANYYNGEPYLDDTYFQVEGWSGSQIYQAGGCVALNEPYWGGVLNTPEMNLQGKLYLSFKVKNNNSNYSRVGFEVILCSSGVFFPDIIQNQSVYPERDNGWTEYMLEFECDYAGEDAFVEFNCYSDHVLIDDVALYRDLGSLTAPTSAQAFNFREDGFDIAWEEVPNADGYYVTLEEETETGTENVSGSWNLDDIDSKDGLYPLDTDAHGWNVSIYGALQVSADGGSNNSQALVLSTDEDEIVYPVTGGMYQNATLTILPLTPLNESNARIVIEGLLDGEWSVIADLAFYQLNAEGPTIIDMAELERTSMMGFVFHDYYTCLRVRGYNFSDERYAIDDLSYETSPETTVKSIAEEWVAEPFISFSDLNPEAEHYYQIRSTQGESQSTEGKRYHALGLAAPQVMVPEILGDGHFFAKWDEVPKADYFYYGVYRIENIVESKVDFPVLSDDFSQIESFYTYDAPYALANTDYEMSLDAYTQIPGWIGFGNIIAGGMLGCNTSDEYQNYIGTPYLTLSNGDGSGVVRMNVYTENSDYFIIQLSEVPYYFYCKGDQWNEITLPFVDGWQHDYLMLYTRYGSKFFIDSIEVVQDQVEAGDHLLWTLQEGLTDYEEAEIEMAVVDGEQYGYQVRAYQQWFRQSAHSEMSELMTVNFDSQGISDMEIDGDQIIKRQWIDLSGRQVSHPESGIYIVTDTYAQGSTKTYKVAIY